jgi:hypothetical protein
MRLAYDDDEGEGQPIEEVFSLTEIECLKTRKSKTAR